MRYTHTIEPCSIYSESQHKPTITQSPKQNTHAWQQCHSTQPRGQEFHIIYKTWFKLTLRVRTISFPEVGHVSCSRTILWNCAPTNVAVPLLTRSRKLTRSKYMWPWAMDSQLCRHIQNCWSLDPEKSSTSPTNNLRIRVLSPGSSPDH